MQWRSVIIKFLLVTTFTVGLSAECEADARAQEELVEEVAEQVVEVINPGEWVTATAYCLPGITASGRPVSHGVIAGGFGFKLGERLEVPGYGTRTVLDRGLLAWDQIDVWMPSCRDAINFGRKRILVWRIN